ncbi:MAG: STAS domain-containing protein, partial [Anaerolineae bacterium]|nr:STAS domain-containing protein [Anaerolineae bacterium]
MEVKLRSISENQIDILELSGRFDAYEAPPVKEWLGKVTARPPAQVVINLAEVNFIDSSGLAVLVQGLKHCRQK